MLHIELGMNPAHNMLPVNFLINPEQNGILGLGIASVGVGRQNGAIEGRIE